MADIKGKSYVFPNLVAEFMSKVDLKTQYEASMLSSVLILIGMVASAIFMCIYLPWGWGYKGIIIFNVISGMIFMSSSLVTTYQQYLSYLEAAAFTEELKEGKETNINQEEEIGDMYGQANKAVQEKIAEDLKKDVDNELFSKAIDRAKGIIVNENLKVIKTKEVKNG